MAPLRHHDVIRLSGTGARKRTCDWLGGHAGGYLLQVKGAPWEYAGRTVKLPKAQMAFRNVLLTTFCYHLDGDGSDGDDCRGGMRLSHFRANSVAISLILTPAAVAVLSAALWAARAASRLRTLSNASIGVLGLTMRSFLRL